MQADAHGVPLVEGPPRVAAATERPPSRGNLRWAAQQPGLISLFSLSSGAAQDVGIPLMHDPCWEADTLFLVFEEDFRYTNVPLGGTPTEGQAGSASGATSSATPAPKPRPKPEVRKRPASHRVTGQWYDVPDKPKGLVESTTTRLADTVHYCIQAQRLGIGDVVWLTWNAGMPGTTVVSKRDVLMYGSNLIAVTRRGASKMWEGMLDGSLGKSHWDLSLKWWLQQHKDTIPASYMVPPLGHWYAHPSDCDPKKHPESRPDAWNSNWVCPGTRIEEDPQKRDKWLVKLIKDGKEPQYVAKLNDPSTPMDWMTYIIGGGKDEEEALSTSTRRVRFQDDSSDDEVTHLGAAASSMLLPAGTLLGVAEPPAGESTTPAGGATYTADGDPPPPPDTPAPASQLAVPPPPPRPILKTASAAAAARAAAADAADDTPQPAPLTERKKRALRRRKVQFKFRVYTENRKKARITQPLPCAVGRGRECRWG